LQIKFELNSRKVKKTGGFLNNKLIKLVFLALVVTQLMTGCGFHLRGQGQTMTTTQLNDVKVYLAVTSEDYLLRRQITNDLQATGLTVVSQPTESSNHLIVLNSKVLRRAIGVDSNGRNNEFELTQNISFLVNYIDHSKDKKNTKIAAIGSLDDELQVQARRSFYLDNIDLIGKREEEKGLLNSIRQEVSRKLISRFVVSLNQQLKQQPQS
jgi:outer membrane lipopolysaccharide assembly protein LptE/RlpB